jgi:hypothetical protein
MTAALRPFRLAKKTPLVAYVGAASGDNAGFQRMIGDEIVKAGGRVSGVKLASPRARLSAARTLLEGADVVFVSGGDVEAGMKILQDRGALPVFRALAEAGRPMVGISAGSIMLGRAWVRFPADGAGHPELFPCMGMADLYVDAHAEEDDWAELRALLRLVGRTRARSTRSQARGGGRPRAPVGYGLTQKGGIRVEPDDERGVKVTPFGTPTPRFVARAGRVVKAPPLLLGSVARAPVQPPLDVPD